MTYNIMVCLVWCHLHYAFAGQMEGTNAYLACAFVCAQFAWLFKKSEFTLSVACCYHCLCVETTAHRVLNISLTSIHPIQLPHPWMQWLWPYQWEILTTQKVGQIKNPPSVCPSFLSVCPHHPLCLTASALWRKCTFSRNKGRVRHYGKLTYSEHFLKA